jgi:hypothetical protein
MDEKEPIPSEPRSTESEEPIASRCLSSGAGDARSGVERQPRQATTEPERLEIVVRLAPAMPQQSNLPKPVVWAVFECKCNAERMQALPGPEVSFPIQFQIVRGTKDVHYRGSVRNPWVWGSLYRDGVGFRPPQSRCIVLCADAGVKRPLPRNINTAIEGGFSTLRTDC